ncbi:hypothetical protein [uncultured Tenacibaculum sp.]|uniref:transmembrane-type terpene cyclase n=1 Tax=uncultured Tenacibaculum sp. TaxID=174713 RepID=UPI002614929C|nr:hypothetical protein [uncultured Tenacibaculum sp.]
MEEILKITSGLCWSTVYIVLIYNGFKYKSYGMPLLALGLNFGWEFFYSFYELDVNDISLQRWINIFWFVLDGVIVYQYFKFGKQYFPKKISGKLFIPWSILIFASCFLVEYMFLYEFGRSQGAKYAAFLQNLIMSFLFIDLLLKRAKIEEFSMIVAICKWIGTLAPTILFGLESNFILVIGGLCCIVDMIYIGVLYIYKKQMQSVAST